MRALPSGTVTLMFTDIEGSTRLLHQLGDRYAEVLADHRRVVRDSVAAHRGVEVDTQGDGFLAAFARASDAVAAAWDVQRALEDGAVRVRIGLHSGEPAVTDEGYVGVDVHRGARLMAAGHGGQILLSERTHALIGGDPRLRDLGIHRLKDFTSPERVFQFGERAFPPLRTLDATNVPVPATRLLGRDRELHELVSLVSEESATLVTITGPGGIGKTRLAIEAASELVGTFHDGAFWVPLSGLADPELVTAEIAQAVGAQDDLVGFARDRELLLLLDNFEHLIGASSTLRELLSVARSLHLLVTSRAPLRVSGEVQYRLEPLAPADAAALFTERATSAGGTSAAVDTIDAICNRLDRLPLAIELAAARTNLLTPETLLQRLASTLPLLTTGPRDAPERQRALRATIEWSYELLDKGAKESFARLAVFAGSFSLEAAEEICESPLDAIDALVDASLLKVIGGDGRLLLLETIREYAAERLSASGDDPAVRRRHAEYYAAFAEAMYADRFDHEGESAAALEADHDNLRAAFDWFATHDPSAELELAGALGWFWISHSHLAEGTRRLDDAMAKAGVQGPSRARALVAAGGLAGRRGATERARQQLEQGIELWRESGDDSELASALDELGWMLFFNADNEHGLRAFEESLRLRRALGDRAGETRALVGVCQLLVAQGEIERTEELSNELLKLARANNDIRSEHFAQHYLADCSLIRGDYDRAAARYRESLETVIKIGDVLETSFEIQGLAMSAAGHGDRVRALTLAAAVEALWEEREIGVSILFWDRLLDRYIGGARRELGPAAEKCWSEGRNLTLDEAIALALGEPRPAVAHPRSLA